MINSLFSQNGYAPVPAYQQAINPRQMDALKGILSPYDAENITETDAKNIVGDVRKLGIAPGKPLAIIFAGEGSDARKIGNHRDHERPSGLRPGQGGPKGEVNTEAISALKTLVESKSGEDISSEEWTHFYNQLEDQGVDTSRPFVDLRL